MRILAVVAAVILHLSPGLAQTSVPLSEFDAASIRLHVEGGPWVFNGMKSPGRFASENQTLRNLIQEAYGRPSGGQNWLPFFVAPGQGLPILGGPGWMGTDRYDIVATWKAARLGDHPTLDAIAKAQAEMNLMLRALLERRFQVKAHRETRDLPVCEMTIAKAGKLRQGNCATFDPAGPLPTPGEPTTDYCGGSRLGRKGVTDWTLDGTGMKMAELADTLSNLIGGRTIVDKTGYTGRFDAHLRWTPGLGEFGAGNVPSSPDDVNESVFTVLEEQLGLKLKTGRGLVEVIVVDRAERPSAN